MEKDKTVPLIGGSSGDRDNVPIPVLLTSAQKFGWDCVQFFNGSPEYYGRRKLDRNSANESLTFMQERGVRAFCHCPFCINLAKDPLEDKKSLNALHADITAMGAAGISSVCHIGHGLKKFTIESVCRTLSCLDFWDSPGSYPLLLENAAGDGTELGVSWEELHFLAQNTDPHIGFCLDTQHAFAGIKPDFQTVDGVNEFLKMADRTLGIRRVKLIHLNDSLWNPQAPKGKKDRHDCCNQGFIWGQDSRHAAGLKHLLLRGGELGIPFVTETGPQDPAYLYDLLLKPE